MLNLANVYLPNSLLFVRDSLSKDLPVIDRMAMLWTTPSWISVCCLPDCDGPTDIIMGNSNEVNPRGALLIDTMLETPSGVVRVDKVPGDNIFEQKVSGEKTRIRIWTDGSITTEMVDIVVG